MLVDEPIPTVARRLGDGSRHRVIKVFYEPSELAARLAELGWSASVREVNPLVLSGIAQPASA